MLYMYDFQFSTSICLYQDPVDVNIITVTILALNTINVFDIRGSWAWTVSYLHIILSPSSITITLLSGWWLWCHHDVKSRCSLDSVYALHLSDKVLGLWWQLAPSSLLHTSPGPPPDSLHHELHSLGCVVGEKGLQLAFPKVGVLRALGFPAFPVFLVQLVHL